MPARAANASRFRIPKLILALEGEPGRASAFGELLRDTSRDEWEAALEVLTRHGVAPYASFLLSRERVREELPAYFVTALRERHRDTQIDHFHLLGERRRLAAAFRDRGIRAVPFKGATLFTGLYEHPGLRPMEDMDWLVQREDLPRAEAVLRDAGYLLPDTLDSGAARRLHFHLAFVKNPGGARVEVHWNLAEGNLFPPARLAAVWAGVQESADEPYARLDELTTLLHLCVHAFKHGSLNSSLWRRPEWHDLVFDPLSGNRLIWLLDIRKLLAGTTLAPAAVVARAREWGVEEAVAGCLLLAQGIFGRVEGWEGVAATIGRTRPGPKLLLLDALAAGLARGDGRAVRTLERLQRLDHTRELRLIRGLDLLDLLSPRPGEAWRWRTSGRGALLPLLYLYRALTGPFAIAAQALPWLRFPGKGHGR